MIVEFNKKKENRSIINQIENYSLGTCSEGCKCQVKVRLTLIDNSIDDYDIVGNFPCHIRSLNEYWGKDMIEEINGELFWKEESNIGLFNTFLDEENNRKVEETDRKIIDAFKENNEWFINEECGSFDESICNAMYNDNIIENKTFDDGIYNAIVEMACWTEYHHEYGAEGDGEGVILILDKIEDIQD